MAALPRRPATVVSLVLVLCLAGCTGDDDGPAAPAAGGESATPLADVDTTSLVVARAPFCEEVAAAAVEAALGGEPTSSDSWDNGEPVDVTGGSDVAHEFGCTWTGDGASPAVASAWVFAPPVTADRARELVRSTTSARGCTEVEDDAALGSPSAAVVCREGDAVEASYRGLLGDAWLTCTVREPATASDGDALAVRAGRWCAAVLAAAGA